MVQAETSGEVMKILCKDGGKNGRENNNHFPSCEMLLVSSLYRYYFLFAEPVGYGDPLIAIRPSFAGIK